MKPSTLSLLLSATASTLAKNNIIGGTETQITAFPYLVSLQTTMHRCGATILDASHILTAAHCVAGETPERLKIRAGSSMHNTGGIVKGVVEIMSHPEFVFEAYRSDIAVLRLNGSLVFGEAVRPVGLPVASVAVGEGGADADTDGAPVQVQVQVPVPGTECSVVGWGVTTPTGTTLSPTLNVVDVEITDHEQCKQQYADHRDVDDKMICAGTAQGGKDACQGDSGGPLIDVASGKQIGIVSWGRGCAQVGQDGVYTSVAAYLDWIEAAVLAVS